MLFTGAPRPPFPPFLLCILSKMAPPLLSPASLGPRLAVGGAPSAMPHWCSVSGQVEEHVARIREELDREREERNYFQLERDKIHTFWEITRRQLEEKKAELRNKDREMEEAEERHQVEIKVSGVGLYPREKRSGWGCFLLFCGSIHTHVH